MTALKTNIDHYMELKNIKKYTHLLVDIARELGYKNGEEYRYAESQKNNFSKMLKGERPLKNEYIIPLEKIFGVSLARLMDEEAYKLPVEKENIPFNKGFRYYTSLDDPELYDKEFDKILDINGKSILNNTDEYGKTFLDYVVENGAENGVKYLYENYKPRMKWPTNQFQFDKTKGTIWIHVENPMPFARLVASMNDADMFYTMFDSYNMFYTNGHYGDDDCIFCTDEYLELIMNNAVLFNDLFVTKEYKLELGNIGKKQYGKDLIIHNTVNPILNNCLKYALCHLQKYKRQAMKILNFGIEHNRRIAEEHNFADCYICNELGAVKDFKNDDFYAFAIVPYEKEIEDEEIRSLIEQLPKFRNYYIH